MKKTSWYLIILVLFLAAIFIFSMKTRAQSVNDAINPAVLGEEDEEDEEDEKDEDEEDEDKDEDEEDNKKEKVTTYIKLPDQILKKTVEITIYDSDGDGVFDPDDSTPNLHNIFIVKDTNLNGIVDEYENR